MPAIQRILIECPVQLRADFGGRDCDYETFNSVHCLKLMIAPGDYTPVANYKSGQPEYVRSLNIPQYSVRAFEPGFDLRVVDDRDIIFYVVQRIATLSTAPDKRTKTDLKVFDFCLPEAEDRAQGYTLRVGAIEPPQAQGGRVVADDGRGWLKGGFTLKFREKEMRQR